MKNKLTLCSIVIALFVIVGCSNSSTTSEQTTTAGSANVDTTKMKTGDVYYQCEMHPEVLSDKPGACPKCGMDLTKTIKK